MKVINVVGARPNFIKIAPIHRALSKIEGVESLIVHTGQHYDERMSDIFFNQLELPKPHFYLGIGGGSHTHQKANVMLAFEEILNEHNPDLVLVVGDVNATAACSITAVKMGVKTVHVEAGLRSNDRNMPEEINRILTDAICNDLFITEHSGLVNLAREGVDESKIHFVGNVMIDSLVYFREKSSRQVILRTLGLKPKHYVLMTMHRPSNVDNAESLKSILEIIKNTAAKKSVVFPVHPRTENNLKKFDLWEGLKEIKNVHLLGPQGYLQFLNLMDNAALIITDSGGIQEETTFLQVPCITFRSSTERPITVELGTNILMSDLDVNKVEVEANKVFDGNSKKGTIPPLWDGNAADRIASILFKKYS